MSTSMKILLLPTHVINEIYISIVQIVQLTFATKSTRSSDAVNIKFSVVRQIIVDNERNLSMEMFD